MNLFKPGRLKRWINLPELIFDFVVFIFFTGAYHFLIPSGKNIIESLTSVRITSLVLLIDIFVSWHLGKLTMDFIRESKRGTYNIIMNKISMAVSIATSLTLAGLIPILLRLKEHITLMQMSFLLVTGIIAVITGLSFSMADTEDGEDDAVSGPGYIVFILVAAAGVILGIVYAIWGFTNNETFTGIAGLVSIIAVPVAAGGLLPFLNRFFNLGVMKSIIVPLLSAILLASWFQVFSALVLESRAVTPALALLALTASGILPLRIIMVFAPPVRTINLIIGLAGLGTAFYRILLY